MTVTATIHTPPPPPQPDTRVVTLQMPYDVAVTLRFLLAYVGGDGYTTYRMHADEIAQALSFVGVLWREDSMRFSGGVQAKPFTE